MKKTDNTKLKKTEQNIETEEDIVKAAYKKFHDAYDLPSPLSSAMDNPLAEAAKEGKDLEFFQKFFESNKKLPDYIEAKHLRSFLGKRPGIFCRFLKYPTFLDMILGVSPDWEKDEKAKDKALEEKAKGEAFINGLKLKMEKEIDRINKGIEERSKGLAERNAEIDKIKAEINKGIEEINKINAEINKGKKDVAKGKEEVDKIRTELLKKNEEIARIREPDERNKEEKENWVNLQKAINIYINSREIYFNLKKCVSGKTVNISELHKIYLNLIECLKNIDPLPGYIKPKDLQDIILKAPVTLSEFFKHVNFVKRLQGVSPDNTSSKADEESWDTFFLSFTQKVNSAFSTSSTLKTKEQSTEPKRKDILIWINQSLELLKTQKEQRNYDQVCKDLAETIERGYLLTKKFLEKHPNLFHDSIEKEIPALLTSKGLKNLLTFAPEYVMKYLDNYYFIARLMADEIKKGSTLIADDLFDGLQNKFALVNFDHKDKVKLLLKHWEIRLRLHLGITLLIREMVKLIGQVVSEKDLKEGKSEEDILNLTDQKVLSTVTRKLNELLIDITSSTEYEWIDELKTFVTKLSKSLPNESTLINIDSRLVYKEIRSITNEINSYLSNESLLKEVKIRAQSLRQEDISNVGANADEYSSANAFKP